MIYGEAKNRNMVRSILPSCGRERARKARKRGNNRHRRTVSHIIQNEEYDDVNIPGILLRYDQREFVDERRGADKIGSFMRWADIKTQEECSPQEKYYSFLK